MYLVFQAVWHQGQEISFEEYRAFKISVPSQPKPKPFDLAQVGQIRAPALSSKSPALTEFSTFGPIISGSNLGSVSILDSDQSRISHHHVSIHAFMFVMY
jgi:hypothetical protein